ncbi:MAG: hypothetical protein A2Z18_07295 [Armatimonadetes bacterium RBG_16_58_9]|nr:MAG: hypothetical protein A2Z18_07295 [Armatimonadetes bacterium RBG_16_58_9]
MGLEELDRMTPKMREKYLEMLRAIPPGRKIELALDFTDSMRDFVIEMIRSENPEADEDFIRREFSKRVMSDDMRRKVYGW